MRNQDIIEFEEKGYAPAGNSNTLKKLRRDNINFKKFDSSVFSCGKRNPKYADSEVFGNRLVYYYDVKKEKELVDFLLKRFLEQNPHPNKELRAAFTRILHFHRLCWKGCYHSGKKIKGII